MNQPEKTSKGKPASPAIRAMPESLSAEAATLASMIIDPACIADVLEHVDAASFYHYEHTTIFAVIVDLWQEREQKVDGLTVVNGLRARGKLEEVGGVEYIDRMLKSVPSSANAVYYAEIVGQKAMLRQLIVAASETLDDAYDETGSFEEKLNAAEQRIFKVASKREKSDAVGLLSLVKEVYEEIITREGAALTGVPTGFYELDQLTAGFQNGHLIIVAGRPSMGKSALLFGVAEHVGITAGMPLAVFSMEMNGASVAERFACSYGRVDSNMTRLGKVTKEDCERLLEAARACETAPMFVDDSGGLTPLQLRTKARRLKAKHGIKIMFVDYLQLMDAGGKHENRQQEITTISRQLKGIARELNIPVVVASQLNRAPENRENHRPRMSDLRESGSIENDADVVLLLHREDYYHRGEEDYPPTNTAEVIVAKARNGPTGIVRLSFLEKFARFENLTAPVQEGMAW